MNIRPILTSNKDVNIKEMFTTIYNSYRKAMGYQTSTEFYNILIKEFFHVVNKPLKDRSSYTVETASGSIAHVVFYYEEELRDKRRVVVGNKPNVDIYLHWGFNDDYLNDLTTWGHDKETYVVKDVPSEIIPFFEGSSINNYQELMFLIRHYKEYNVWDESILEEEEEE